MNKQLTLTSILMLTFSLIQSSEPVFSRTTHRPFILKKRKELIFLYRHNQLKIQLEKMEHELAAKKAEIARLQLAQREQEQVNVKLNEKLTAEKKHSNHPISPSDWLYADTPPYSPYDD